MPEWLPELLPLDPWRENSYDILYEIFVKEILNVSKDNRLLYLDNPVWIFPDLEEGKEKIFWHLTSRTVSVVRRNKRKFNNPDDNERYPDMRRCERLLWVRAIIDNASSDDVLNWDIEEDDCIKTYLWLRKHDFVVILKKYPNNKRRIVTSFHVDNEVKRRDFEKKYGNRIV